MTELFELIASKPLEFLAGLGVSSTAIYTLCSLFRFLFNLITKKSQKKKEQLQRNQIAEAVIEKLSSAEQFLDIIVAKVVEAIEKSKIMDWLKTISEKENCPIELKAYIETVLGQVGNEDLLLLYEQAKAILISTSKNAISDIIDKGEERIDEEKIEQSDDTEKVENENDSNTESEEGPQTENEEVIDYA